MVKKVVLLFFLLTTTAQGSIPQDNLDTPPPVSLSVSPKVAMRERQATFRVHFRIEPHTQNASWSYSASCGSELRHTQRKVERITEEWYEQLTVLGDCYFLVCVHRVEGRRVKNYCDEQWISTL